ncbi:MAG: amino acid adenylation domain-containing protein, partial [Candidatus Aminicenantes bacterium]|nr:amino acid adenylation domain-containing protein [Candidatus Aminicenantes bacterium]
GVSGEKASPAAAEISSSSRPVEYLYFMVEYCSDLFMEETIERFRNYFKNIVTSVLKNPQVKLSEIEILPIEEKQQILYEFNDTESDFPRDKTLHELFREQVAKMPAEIALRHGERSLTFAAWNQESNRLAKVLRTKGVGPDTIVAILVDRSIEMLTGIMGILKSGGAYMPINPGYPAERIELIMRDSAAKFLTAPSSDSVNIDLGPGIEVIDLIEENHRHGDGGNPQIVNNPRDMAYVIYTSGSTGTPKGTLIEHRSVVNILKNMEELYPLKEEDAYLLKTNYIFDVSVTEIFCLLFGSGKLALLEAGKEGDPEAIAAAVKRDSVTHINFVPSMLNVFLDYIDKTTQADLQSLKYVIVAGEAFPVPLAKKAVGLLGNARIENIYGPTEATVYTTGYPLPPVEEIDRVPIGRPLNNIRNYVVDKHFNPQPIGVSGEFCIGGVCLARGYLNRPELTTEKFVLTSHQSPLTLYRTGDLVRWLPGGNIEFLGRLDHQVKIRGFRIELGEIENRLLAHEQVKEAVVLVRESKVGEKHLCAYIAAKSPEQRTGSEVDRGESLSSSHLRQYLSRILPDYMVPAFFVFLD